MKVTFSGDREAVLTISATETDVRSLIEALKLRLQERQFQGMLAHRSAGASAEHRWTRSAHAVAPVAQVAGERKRPRLTASRVTQVFRNAFSLRLIFGALLLGGIVAVFLPAWLFWPVALGAWLIGTLNPYNFLFCPNCQKRVKAGSTACQRCGHALVPQ